MKHFRLFLVCTLAAMGLHAATFLDPVQVDSNGVIHPGVGKLLTNFASDSFTTNASGQFVVIPSVTVTQVVAPSSNFVTITVGGLVITNSNALPGQVLTLDSNNTVVTSFSYVSTNINGTAYVLLGPGGAGDVRGDWLNRTLGGNWVVNGDFSVSGNFVYATNAFTGVITNTYPGGTNRVYYTNGAVWSLTRP